MNKIKENTHKVGINFIKALLSISLVFGFSFVSPKQVLAAENQTTNQPYTTVETKAVTDYPLTPIDDNASTSNAGNPYNPFKSPIVEIINALYKKTFTKQYDKIAQTLLDALFSFFGEETGTYSEVDPVMDKIELMEKDLSNISAQAQKTAYDLKMQMEGDRFKDAVEPINSLLSGTNGKNGMLGLIDTEINVNIKNMVDSVSNDKGTMRQYVQCLDEIATIDRYDEHVGNDGELQARWNDLWAICTDATKQSDVNTTMEYLYQCCLTNTTDRDEAIQNFQGFYQSWISTCLTANYVLTISNAARIEEATFVANHWDAFKGEDGKWEGHERDYWEFIATNTPSYQGVLIQRAKFLSEDRRDVLTKMQEYNLLVLQTPSYNLHNTSTGESYNFHSFGDLWVNAQEKCTENWVITLNSDVVTSLKNGQKDIYGRILTENENMTSSLVDKNTDLVKRTYFRNGSLNLTADTPIKIDLNGYSIANLNSANPSIYLNSVSSLTTEGRPIDQVSNVMNNNIFSKFLVTVGEGALNLLAEKGINLIQTNETSGEIDDQVGQIDGISCDANAGLNLSHTVFDNTVDKRQYTVPEEDPTSETYPSIVVQVNRYDKAIPANYIYATDGCTVNTNSCYFTMTNANNIPDTFISAINMDSDKTNQNSSSLTATSSLFKNLVSKADCGAAIKSNSSINAKGCEFNSCSSNKSGGAIAHFDEHQYKINDDEMNPILFENCKFNGNSSAADGGAISNQGYVKFNNCTLENNKATNDGAVVKNTGISYDTWVWEGQSYEVTDYLDGKTEFISTKFIGNETEKGNGGAISTNCGIEGTKSSFDNNKANKCGGAIDIYKTNKYPEESEFDLTCCLADTNIDNNHSSDGGGIYNGSGSGSWSTISSVILDNSKVDNNRAAGNYGGVYSSRNIDMYSNSTVLGNKSALGCAGLHADEMLDLSDSPKIYDNYSYEQGKDMDACINDKGLFIEKSLKSEAKVNVCVRKGKYWLTDDKTNQSQEKIEGKDWSTRLEESAKYLHVTNVWGDPENITIDADVYMHKYVKTFARDTYVLTYDD